MSTAKYHMLRESGTKNLCDGGLGGKWALGWDAVTCPSCIAMREAPKKVARRKGAKRS